MSLTNVKPDLVLDHYVTETHELSLAEVFIVRLQQLVLAETTTDMTTHTLQSLKRAVNELLALCKTYTVYQIDITKVNPDMRAVADIMNLESELLEHRFTKTIELLAKYVNSLTIDSGAISIQKTVKNIKFIIEHCHQTSDKAIGICWNPNNILSTLRQMSRFI